MNNRIPRESTRRVAAFMFRLPFMIDCATFEDFILDYLEGTLPARQKIVFNMHLRLCKECRVYLAEYKSAIALAASQRDVPFSAMDMGKVPQGLIEAIVEAQKE